MTKIWVVILAALSLLVGCKESTAQAQAESDKTPATSTKSASTPAQNTISEKVVSQLKAALAANTELKVTRVEATPVEGLFAVFLEAGDILYSNASGTHFVAGDLYEIIPEVKGMKNVTEGLRSQQRVEILNSIETKDTITFAAKDKAKGHVYVFTDVDCYYCQKLHAEMAQLNEAGLEVRYLAFPRAGLKSESYTKIQSAWCAKDKQTAMDKLKARQSIPEDICSSTAVAEQYLLGQQLGVRGTPSIFTADGELISGYLPAKQLLGRVGIN